MNETFICANCKKQFPKTPLAEALDFYIKDFPNDVVSAEETDLLCDDCYAEVKKWADSQKHL